MDVYHLVALEEAETAARSTTSFLQFYDWWWGSDSEFRHAVRRALSNRLGLDEHTTVTAGMIYDVANRKE